MISKLFVLLLAASVCAVACGPSTGPPPVPTPEPTEVVEPPPTPIIGPAPTPLTACTRTGDVGADGPLWKGDCQVNDSCKDIGGGMYAGNGCETRVP